MTRGSEAAKPPEVLLSEAESNPIVARIKSSLAKRWSLTRMDALYEVFDLASFLWALDRSDEALALAAAVASGIPEPPELPGGGSNYNLWCPATFCHALVLHLARSDRRGRAEAIREALRRDPGIARGNTQYIRDSITRAREAADAPLPARPTKLDRQGVARHLGSMVLYLELAKIGDRAFRRHRDAASELMSRLRERLRGMHDAAGRG